jgi:hypothetical protein
MKKFLIVLVIIIVLGAAGWFFFLRGDDEVPEQTAEKQNFPVQHADPHEHVESVAFTSPFNNLSFQHPNNWNVVESSENTADEQLITVESLLDTNEFYFCLDLNMLATGIEGDFTATDSKVISSKQLESGRHAITYTINDLDGIYWSITDNAIEVGATTFPNELTGQSGRMQVFGRFNCREETKTEFSVEHFQNSQWLNEAEAIVNSLEF